MAEEEVVNLQMEIMADQAVEQATSIALIMEQVYQVKETMVVLVIVFVNLAVVVALEALELIHMELAATVEQVWFHL